VRKVESRRFQLNPGQFPFIDGRGDKTKSGCLYRLELGGGVCFVQVTGNSNNLLYRLEIAVEAGGLLRTVVCGRSRRPAVAACVKLLASE